MPIEGFLNKVAAFYRTEVLLAKPERSNTFANESLWYVQYFFGRETLGEQEGKFYLFQKSDAPNTPWVSSSIKTTAYFFSALIWIIPGTIARLLSFDSPEVTTAVFADRITPCPPKTRKVPRPVPLIPSLPPQPKNNAVFTKESSNASSDSKEVEAPELDKALPPPPITPETPPISPVPTQPPQVTHPETPELIKNPPSPPLTVAAAAIASTNINRYRILSELESSKAFFTELNALPDNRRKVRDWLKKKEKEPNYQNPLLFAFNLHGCVKENPATVAKTIPEKSLIAWQETFAKAAAKLQGLGLSTKGVDMAGEKTKPQKSIEDEHLDYIIEFYTTFIKLTTNRVDWLERKVLETKYRFPFFNALYFQVWANSFVPPLDPEKLRFLKGYHKRCLPILYAEGLEHHLAEIPNNLSPGICALMHCMTADLTVPSPDQTLKPSCKPTIDDAVLKSLLINGLASVALLPGIQAIFVNDRLFLRNKYKLMEFLDQTWKNYIELFKAFLDLPYRTRSDKRALQTWIDLPKQKLLQGQSLYIAQFSKDYQHWIKTLRPILSEAVYNEWNDLYKKCIERLKTVGLLSYTHDPLPSQSPKLESEIAQNEQIMQMIIRFFERFNCIPLEKSAAWLAQEASKKGYIYPFFLSFDLQCKIVKLEPHLNQAAVSQWKVLYEQACFNLEKLGLRNYLDEIPLNYLKDLFQSMHEGLLSRLSK